MGCRLGLWRWSVSGSVAVLFAVVTGLVVGTYVVVVAILLLDDPLWGLLCVRRAAGCRGGGLVFSGILGGGAQCTGSAELRCEVTSGQSVVVTGLTSPTDWRDFCTAGTSLVQRSLRGSTGLGSSSLSSSPSSSPSLPRFSSSDSSGPGCAAAPLCGISGSGAAGGAVLGRGHFPEASSPEVHQCAQKILGHLEGRGGWWGPCVRAAQPGGGELGLGAAARPGPSGVLVRRLPVCRPSLGGGWAHCNVPIVLCALAYECPVARRGLELCAQLAHAAAGRRGDGALASFKRR